KRPSSNLGECLWVRFPPVLLKFASAGHWRASLPVKQSPFGCAGSTPARRTDGPFVCRRKDAGPSSRKDGFDSHTGYMAKWWNRETREAQNLVPKGVGVRLSPWSLLRSGLESGFQHGLISRSTPVRIRPPQLDWPSTQIGKAARSRAW